MTFLQCKLRPNLIFFIVSCLVLLAACGGGSSDSTTNTGAVSFNVVYHDAGNLTTQTAVLDCEGDGVATVEAAVYATDNTFIVGGGPWNCDDGQGTIASVPAGSGRVVVILGKDTEGNVVFRGEKSDIQVNAGSNNDAGVIDCFTFVPILKAPADGAVVNADTMGLSWNDISGATAYRIIVSENDNLGDPLIDDSATDPNYSPSGLTNAKAYYWQVIASDVFDNAGAGSQIWSFTVDMGHENAAPIAQITSPAQGSSYIEGEEIVFAGSGSDSEDGELSGDLLQWHSDVDESIGKGETFTSAALSVGTHLITLTVMDSEGAKGAATVEIIINEASENNPPVVQITSPDAGSTFSAADSITFAGSGLDSEDGDLDGESLVWSSDVDGLIGTGKTCSSRTLVAGEHRITLTVKDSNGATAMNTVTISIPPGRLPDTGQDVSDPYINGEDADYEINPPSYTKMDALGNALDKFAADWAMVRDNVTGLIWEVKIDDGGIHDPDDMYTWNDIQEEFIASLNNSNFGGHSDWRLPTIQELYTIVQNIKVYGDPKTNIDYFPNTKLTRYWSSIISAGSTDYAWFVNFGIGYNHWDYRPSSNYVRAVRGAQPVKNFVNNNDGTVTDTATGLMWQLVEADAATMNWKAALDYCENLMLAGYEDWRLPNSKELQSIVDYKAYDPAIDETSFQNTKSTSYWSSTTFLDKTTESAWGVNFISGRIHTGDKSESYYVRAVRGGH